MKLSDHLTKEQKHKLNRMQSKHKKPPNNMSRKDWEYIMGKNMDTYKRVNGSVRRR